MSIRSAELILRQLIRLSHLADGLLRLFVDRLSPLLDRPRFADLVHRLTLGGVELVPVVRRLARLLEPRSKLGSRIGLERLRVRPAKEPPEGGQP